MADTTGTMANNRHSVAGRLSDVLYRHPNLYLGLLLLLPLLWFGAIYFGSLLTMLWQGFYTFDDFSMTVSPELTLANFRALFQPSNYDIILRTLYMAIAVTVCSALLAFPIAYYMARYTSGKTKAFFYIAVNTIFPAVDTSDWDLTKRSDIVVRSSGSAAHIYFNVAPRRLTLGEITLLYPELLQSLVDHPGIGMVVAREGDCAIALGTQGQALITREGVDIEGQNPLELATEPQVAAGQICYLASFPHSGDLIVFGGWHRPGEIVAFEDQISTHGGLGGPQGYPFILYPAQYALPAETITNARQLYPFFADLYLPHET